MSRPRRDRARASTRVSRAATPATVGRADTRRVRRAATTLPDVAVVGGGIIGCAIARELATAGARVALFDRGDPGAEASSAAAGMLGPQAECDAPGPLHALGMASRELYPEIVAALREETGIDPELDRDGIIYVALDGDEEAVLARRAAWQRRAGFRVEALRAADVAGREPALTTAVRSALWFPDDSRLDNVRLTRAYAVAAARAGVAVHPGTPVLAVERDGSVARGIRTPAGVVAAGVVVNAAGAWSAQLVGVTPVPVAPVRGQMVVLTSVRSPLRHAIYWHGVYLVPRRDGRVLAGSTYEHVGFDKRVTAAATEDILARAFRVAPALREATFAGAWAGLRPWTADLVPVIGADPEVRGVMHATGHYRNGILLAPLTARVVRDLVIDGRSAVDVAACSPARFVRTPRSVPSRSAATDRVRRSR